MHSVVHLLLGQEVVIETTLWFQQESACLPLFAPVLLAHGPLVEHLLTLCSIFSPLNWKAVLTLQGGRGIKLDNTCNMLEECLE